MSLSFLLVNIFFIIVVLWCKVWVMNVRWEREKEKAGVGISLHLSKGTKGAARLNVPIWWRNCYHQYICFHNICITEGFNPGIFGTETSGWGSAPPSLLIQFKGEIPTLLGIETDNFAPQRQIVCKTKIQPLYNFSFTCNLVCFLESVTFLLF